MNYLSGQLKVRFKAFFWIRLYHKRKRNNYSLTWRSSFFHYCFYDIQKEHEANTVCVFQRRVLKPQLKIWKNLIIIQMRNREHCHVYFSWCTTQWKAPWSKVPAIWGQNLIPPSPPEQYLKIIDAQSWPKISYFKSCASNSYKRFQCLHKWIKDPWFALTFLIRHTVP